MKGILSFLVALAISSSAYSNIANADDALGTAASFNLFVLEDFVSTSSDVQGRLAAGGDVRIDSYGVASTIDTSPEEPTLVVGGDLFYGQGKIFTGSALVGGTIDGVNETVTFGLENGASIVRNASIDIDFVDEFSKLSQLSIDLAGAEPTGAIEYKYGGIYITGDCQSRTQIFRLNGQTVLNSNHLVLNCIPDDATILFNIDGATTGFKNIGLSQLHNRAPKVMYNFYEASAVEFTWVGIEGTVLAPMAHLSNPRGQVNGTVIAKSWNGPMELHHFPFTGDLQPALGALNQPPVTRDQDIQTAEDVTIPIVLEALDEDGDLLEYAIVNQPQNGTLSGTLPNLQYTPTDEFNGSDSFTFKVNDGVIDSNVSAVNISISAVNDPPVAEGISLILDEDATLDILLVGFDLDNDLLTYNLLTQPSNGSLFVSGPNVVYTPNPNFNGNDSFSFSVSDGELDSNIATVSITVSPTNDAPVANAQSLTTGEDTPLPIVLSGSDIDSEIFSYQIQDSPNNGSLSGLGSNLIYTPSPDFSGTDVFTFIVNDGELSSGTANVVIDVLPINDAPQAQSQVVITPEDIPLVIILAGSDLENNALSYQLLSQPANGVLSGSGATLTYTPHDHFNGSDSFTFKVNDGALDSNVADILITVTPVNDAPEALNQSIATDENVSVDIVLIGTDIDNETLSFTIQGLPSNGTLSGSAPNVTYTPNSGYFGEDAFTFLINDGDLSSSTATVSILVNEVNRAPVANAQNIDTEEDVAVSLELTGSDADGDDLSYSIQEGPANGVLAGVAPRLTYTPNNGFNGNDSFSFLVNDGNVNSSQGIVSITVLSVNDPPVADAQNLTTDEDVTLSVRLTGSDPEGSTLSYTIQFQPENGSLSGTPPDLIYSPNPGYKGDDSFIFTVNDGELDSPPERVRIAVLENGLLPDLTIKQMSSELVETDAQSMSTSGSLTFTIVNQGQETVKTPFSALAFYDENRNGSYEETEDSNLGLITITDEQLVGVNAEYNIDLEGFLPFRDAPIHVFVDSSLELLELNENNNISTTADECEASFLCQNDISTSINPKIKWTWSDEKVMTSPVVGPFFDTNGDGAIDQNDTSMVVVASHTGFVDSASAKITVINGVTGQTELVVSDPNLLTRASSHPALGDIDADGEPEIIFYSNVENKVVALDNSGQAKWVSEVGAIVQTSFNYGAISLADIDGDGLSEVLARDHVFNSDGTLRFKLNTGFRVDHATYSTTVDMNLDGVSEIVFGGRVYNNQGEPFWQNEPPVTVGFHAIGNFDEDEFPEIVVSNIFNTLYLIDHDGTILWQRSIRRSGAPVVANVDSDPYPEIGVATGPEYRVYKRDGSLLWSHPTGDRSGVTGSTIFDFDQDGRAEIIYGAARSGFIFNGENGDILFDIPRGSETATEAPVVADVNGDGSAEILMVSDTPGSNGYTVGLVVLENEGEAWASTRSIWNQHPYSIDNINDDGSIPPSPVKGWLTHNSFRLNTFPQCFDGSASETTRTVYLNEQNTIVSLGEGMLAEPFQNRSAADSLASIIDAGAADSPEDHNQQTHVWVSGRPLSLRFDFGTEYDLRQLHFWNYFAEDFDVDNVDFTFFDESNNVVGNLLNIVPKLGGNSTNPIFSETIPLSFPSNARFVNAVLTGSNNEVDFNNIGFTGKLSSARQRADLSISKLRFSNTQNAVFARFGNGGSLISDADVKANVYRISISGNRILIGTINISDLESGEYVDLQLNNVTGLQNNDQIEVVIDEDNDIDECRENNNRLAITVEGNNPPEIISSSSQEPVYVGMEFNYDVDAVDVDGDSLEYGLEQSSFAIQIDSVTGEISWQPSSADVGIVTVEVFVRDGQGGVATQIFTVLVKSNQPPVIESTAPDAPIPSGSLFTYQVIASDPESQPLSFSLTEAPSGMSINPVSGLVNWQPTTDQIGNNAIVITVTDEFGLNDTQSFQLAIVSLNEPPQIISTPLVTANVGVTYSYQIEAIDSEGDELTYLLIDGPNGLTINPQTGLLNWLPDSIGAQNISISVTDSAGLTDSQAWVITVDSLEMLCEFEEPSELVTLYGSVTNVNTGIPIAGAVVEVVNQGITLSVITASDGSYLFNSLARGTISVGVSATAYLGVQRSLELDGSSLFELSALMVPQNEAGEYIVNQPVTIRDFNASHPDFEGPIGRDPGIVAPELSADKKPIYAAPEGSSTRTTSGRENFEQWYRDVEGTNLKSEIELPFVFNQETNTYSFNDSAFFPIDDMLFGNEGRPHNYHFTMEYEGQFRYIGGEIFEFSGDDDLWLYINDKLAIDLGFGIVSGTVNLDAQAEQLGIEIGGVYPIKMFFAERHTVLSNFNAETSIELTALSDLEPQCGVVYFFSSPVQYVTAGLEYQYRARAKAASGEPVSYNLTNAPTGMSIDAETGLISWSTSIEDEGQYTVVVLATTEQGRKSQQEFVVRVTTDSRVAPTIISTPILVTAADAGYEYAIEIFDPTNTGVRVELVSGPEGLQVIDNTLKWVPELNDIGDYAVSISAINGYGRRDTQTWVLTVFDPDVGIPNLVPVIESVPPSNQVMVESPFIYPVIASDPEGQPLTFTFEQAPSGMAISSDGEITWQPSSEQIGEQLIVVNVEDRNGGSVSQSFSLLVIDGSSGNRSPSIVSEPILNARVGLVYNYQLQAVDEDGDNLNYSVVEGPAGLVVSDTGLVSWSPTLIGSAQARVRVSDQQFFVDQIWPISVLDADSPLDGIVSVTPKVVNDGDQIVVDVQAINAIGNFTIALTIDGIAQALDQNNQVQLTADGVGLHQVVAVISDEVETIELTQSYSVRDPNDSDAPLASFDSLVDGQIITAPIDIVGTIQDANISSWQVISRAKSAQPNEVSVLASGNTNVTNETLVTFDPSLIRNGQYTIFLVAEDASGQITQESITVEVDRDLKVGNFSITFEDLDVPLGGIPISVRRTYDSRDRAQSRDFGFGWSLDYQNVKIEESRTIGLGWSQNEYATGPLNTLVDVCTEPKGAPIVSVTLPDGDVERFEVGASPRCNLLIPINTVELTFTSVGDTQTTLEAVGVSPFYFKNDSLTLDIDSDELANPSQYRLTTRSGFVYDLDQDFGVSKVTDPNGNTLTYSDDGIVHSDGKRVDFVRDALGRVTQVIDPMGRALNYNYDENGDLRAAIERDSATTTFTYNQRHGLLDVIDPLGRNLVRNIYDDQGRLVAQQDSDGFRTEFTHNLTGRESVVTDRNGNTSFLYYDENGYVTSQVDALGNTTNYTLDANGNELTQTNALGHTTVATYNDNNDQLTQTDALGNVTGFEYNQRGKETKITDARGNVFVNSYDDVGNLLTVTDPLDNRAGNDLNRHGLPTRTVDVLGNETFASYDDEGNKLTETDAEGNLMSFTYDANNNVLSETTTRMVNGVAVQETTSYEYDSRDRAVKTVDALGNQTQTEYDLVGNEVVQIDALGRRTEMQYDAYKRLLSTVYPDGTTQINTYDPEGNLLTETDRLGRTTTHEYDALYRLIASTQADGSITRTEYDAIGRVVAEVDANGNRTTHAYDAADRRISTTDALGNVTQFGYDADGNMVQMTDANGNITRYVFNELDQKVQTTFANASTMLDGLDALSRKTSMTDQAGVITNYEYDKLGRLITVTDALEQETTFTYDSRGNKLTQTDSEGRTTAWAYDALGRVISRTLPEGQIETMQYDAIGNMTQRTDFKGQVALYSYDINDRLIAIIYEGGLGENYSYDAIGNRTQATKTENGDTSSWLYTYDELNRISSETQFVGTAQEVTLSYEYDAQGNRVTLTETTANAARVTRYTFDSLNRLKTVQDPDANITTYQYDAVGNRIGMTHQNGIQTNYLYDELNRLTSVSHKNSTSVTLKSFDYTLLANGKRAKIEEANGRVTDYTYDDLYRLTAEAIFDPVNANHNADYTYDTVGNRVFEVINGVSTQYTYNDNDWLMQSGGTSFTYDQNGSTLTETLDGVVTSYAYNTKNELISQTKAGEDTAYLYNVDGMRVGQADSQSQTLYVLDNNRSYAQVITELTDGNKKVTYTYGDDLVSQKRDAVSTYHYDGLGSTRALSDGAGIITDEYDYDSFGETLNQSGDTEIRKTTIYSLASNLIRTLISTT